MRKAKKRWAAVIGVIAALWLAAGAFDFWRVTHFERPVFCLLVNGADDGGSGQYIGLGYSFEIEGNFMPEEELPGVTRYRTDLFGIAVGAGARD